MSIPEFKLDAFEGPLDLLLHLIAKHKLNIYDIEISLLLDQYLEYIEGLEEQDFDSAGDFLAMAARLVYIKTCSLLPQPEEAEEMKKELQGELLDYSECKAAAARLLGLSVYGEVFVRPPEKLPINRVFTGSIDPQKLVEAYLGMNAKTRNLKPVRAEQFTPLVKSRFVTVTSKIIHVLKRLLRSGECTVAELYEGVEDKSSRVATFLAVLELAKSGRISLNDDNSVISFNRSAPRKHDHSARTAEKPAKDEYAAPSMTVERVTPKEEYTSPAVTVERVTPKEEYTSPSVNIEPAEEKKPAARSIALEAASTRHSLAIPAFSLFIDEQPSAVEEKPAAEEPPVSGENACIKINRFGKRCYWGYPVQGSCWSYRRERL